MSAIAARPVVDPREIFADPHQSALADAIAVGDPDLVRSLAATADLSARGDRGVTLLQWALLNQRLDSFGWLLELGADPLQPGIDGDTVAHLAARIRDPAFLDALLARGLDPNAVANAVTGSGLLAASLMGDAEAQFRALLRAGANPGRADRMGNTPLHVAALTDQPQRVLDLLEAGADPAARNVQGVTFQRYLFMGRLELLHEPAARSWEAVLDWMQAHDIPLDGPAQA